MREFLNVLRSYEIHGIDELAPTTKIADFLRIRYGGTNDAKRQLGSVAAIRDAFVGIQAHLFCEAGFLRVRGQAVGCPRP